MCTYIRTYWLFFEAFGFVEDTSNSQKHIETIETLPNTKRFIGRVVIFDSKYLEIIFGVESVLEVD